MLGKAVQRNFDQMVIKMANVFKKLILGKQIGSVPNTGDSVKEIRKIRKNLSKDFSLKNLDEINALHP